jgi:large subunit ribosomal protein L21
MYAVVATGGKQYRVEPGGILRIEKIGGEVGETISLDEVLMFSDGDDVKVGTPRLDDITVTANIVEQGKAKKIIIFKQKRRKRYRSKRGHRQEYTAIRIEAIAQK